MIADLSLISCFASLRLFIKNCGVNWRVILPFYLLRMSRLIYNKRQKGRGVLGASLIFVSPAQRALSWGVFRKFSKGNVLERQEGQSKEFCVWHERFLSPQFSSYKSVPVVSLWCPCGVPGIMQGICSTRLRSEMWQLYSALQLTSQTALLAAGLGRTGSTRGLRVCPGWWLVLSLRSSLCSRGCPRDLAGPQPEKYHLRTVWRQTDRQHGTLTSYNSEESLNTNLSEGSRNRNRS